MDYADRTIPLDDDEDGDLVFLHEEDGPGRELVGGDGLGRPRHDGIEGLLEPFQAGPLEETAQVAVGKYAAKRTRTVDYDRSAVTLARNPYMASQTLTSSRTTGIRSPFPMTSQTRRRSLLPSLPPG